MINKFNLISQVKNLFDEVAEYKKLFEIQNRCTEIKNLILCDVLHEQNLFVSLSKLLDDALLPPLPADIVLCK